MAPSTQIAEAECLANGERSQFSDFIPAFALLAAGLIALLIAFAASSEDRGQYVIVTAPWADTVQTIRQISSTGGGFLEFGGFSNIVLAASSDPDFVSSMQAEGAWLVLPLPRLAGCFALSGEAEK
ncbi:hypothetical protein [Aureimonas fodinaquatilis]|uniref:hypothetical protein n=1 Tax=Aureimonas fodinaquatilis TaxID=2565783 RepID=UPI0011EC84EB|nr:hypothetical protein [Aureimonas fodinaquatilis]